MLDAERHTAGLGERVPATIEGDAEAKPERVADTKPERDAHADARADAHEDMEREGVDVMQLRCDATRIEALGVADGSRLAESELLAAEEGEEAALHEGFAHSPSVKHPEHVHGVGALAPGGQYEPMGQMTCDALVLAAGQ